MPTPIAVYFVASAAADTTALVTPSFTPSNGELITVAMTSWDTAVPNGATSGGGQTYSTVNTAQPGGFNGYARIDACTIAGTPGAMTVTTGGTASNTRHCMCVIRWPVGTTIGAINATKNGSGQPGATVTTGAAASALFAMWVDLQSLDPATLALRPDTATLAGLGDFHVGTNTVHYAAYTANVGAAGAKTAGATAPTPQTWTMVAVEILDAGGTTWPVDQTDSTGLTDPAALAVSKPVTDSAGLTDPYTAAASKPVTDLAGLTDAATVSGSKAATDVAGLTDSWALTTAPAVVDNTGLTDPAVLSGSRSFAVIDSVGLTDGAVVTAFTPGGASAEWSAGLPRLGWHATGAHLGWQASNPHTGWRASNARAGG